jgi:hypothetical protein
LPCARFLLELSSFAARCIGGDEFFYAQGFHVPAFREPAPNRLPLTSVHPGRVAPGRALCATRRIKNAASMETS